MVHKVLVDLAEALDSAVLVEAALAVLVILAIYSAIYLVVHSEAESRFFKVGDYLFIKTDGERDVLYGYEGADTDLTLPATAKGRAYDIRMRAFRINRTLTRAVIPEGVVRIGEKAFGSCRALAEVVLPTTLREIGDSAFSNCVALARIEIPTGVKSIPKSCFEYCEALTLVVIPEGVEQIGNMAFYKCKALEIIVIPTSVTQFGSATVSGCDALKGFFYAGNADAWKKIAEEKSNMGEPLAIITREKYYYAESDPADGGKYWHWVDGMPVEYAS